LLGTNENRDDKDFEGFSVGRAFMELYHSPIHTPEVEHWQTF